MLNRKFTRFLVFLVLVLLLFPSCKVADGGNLDENFNQSNLESGYTQSETENGNAQTETENGNGESVQPPEQGEEENNAQTPPEQDFKPSAQTEYKNVYYANSGNSYQQMDVILPQTVVQTGKKAPAVITLHGGNWIEGYGDRTSYSYITSFINECGCVHVNLDYRLSTPSPAGNGIGIEQMLEDIGAAIDYLYKNADIYCINTSKIALMGYSAGGHLALLYAYKNPEKISLVISEAGPTDLYSVALEADEQWQALFKNLVGVSAGEELNCDLLKAVSPLWVLQREGVFNAPYTVLAYGSDAPYSPETSSDGLVPYIQALSVHRLLSQVNGATLFELINVSHGDIGENALICPSSLDTRSREYYYGSERYSEGLEQIIKRYLFES